MLIFLHLFYKQFKSPYGLRPQTKNIIVVTAGKNLHHQLDA